MSMQLYISIDIDIDTDTDMDTGVFRKRLLSRNYVCRDIVIMKYCVITTLC
jgi:hypothetical protein